MGRRKHDCYYTDYDDICCSECPNQRGCRDYGGYEENEGRARYVCGSCPNCSYWDDFFGCHNGNEPGDRCTDADVW